MPRRPRIGGRPMRFPLYSEIALEWRQSALLPKRLRYLRGDRIVSSQTRTPASEVLLFGVIWGLVGSIFAGLFVVFWAALELGGYGAAALLIAAALAGAIGAAFYGAMQVAILGTLVGIIATLVFVVASGGQSSPGAVLAVAGAAGAVLGSGFGAVNKFLVRGALCKAFAGLVGGIVAAAIVLGLRIVFPDFMPTWLVTGILVPVTGYVYVALVGSLENRLAGKIPLFLLGAVVAGILAAVVGATLWAVGGTATGTVAPAVSAAIEKAGTLMPSAVAGGSIGGIVAGLLLAIAQRPGKQP